jgi:hypothetical protein
LLSNLERGKPEALGRKAFERSAEKKHEKVDEIWNLEMEKGIIDMMD